MVHVFHDLHNVHQERFILSGVREHVEETSHAIDQEREVHSEIEQMLLPSPAHCICPVAKSIEHVSDFSQGIWLHILRVDKRVFNFVADMLKLLPHCDMVDCRGSKESMHTATASSFFLTLF